MRPSETLISVRAGSRACWRGAALMPVAVVAVHQLRYWLAYGP